MADYAILLDGERVASIDSDNAVRTWIANYREDHADDDPAATHVQILERGAFAWLTGGRLVDRERFF